MKIDFQIIGHNEHRYPTVGDYWIDGDTWLFRVSRLSDGRYEWLIFVHELVEAAYCYLRGITFQSIDDYDRMYEIRRGMGKRRAQCGCRFQAEPGWDKHAPYHKGHMLAEACERLLAKALKVKWKVYNDEIESLNR